MRWLKQTCIVCASLLLLAGCMGDHSDLDRRIQQVKQQPGDPIEPLPTIDTPEPFVYQAHDLRDPFQGQVSAPTDTTSTDLVAGGEGPKPDPYRRREALEDFEFDSLDMVGTIFVDDQLFGLVVDPDGLLYRVQDGNYMGRNHGRITAVYEDRIEVVELYSDGAGRWREQTGRLRLDPDGA